MGQFVETNNRWRVSKRGSFAIADPSSCQGSLVEDDELISNLILLKTIFVTEAREAKLVKSDSVAHGPGIERVQLWRLGVEDGRFT